MQRKHEGDLELAEKYLYDAEVIANKYDNEMEIAYTNYLRGLIKMNASDYIQVLDCLYTAYTGFLSVGALNYAMDCYNEICEISASLKSEFVSSVKGTLKDMQDNSEQQII